VENGIWNKGLISSVTLTWVAKSSLLFWEILLHGTISTLPGCFSFYITADLLWRRLLQTAGTIIGYKMCLPDHSV
jgi:hypothetical protein